jgi:hypothetical protein
VTKQDFILSIVSSIIATILYKLGQKTVVYLRSKPFRKKRRRFIRNVIARSHLVINDSLISPFVNPIRSAFPAATAIAMLLLASFLSVHLNRNTRQNRMVAERVQARPIPDTISSMPNQQVRVRTFVEMEPCSLNKSIDEPKKSQRALVPTRETTSIECIKKSIESNSPLRILAITMIR